jgi:hypothetical protein
MSLVIAEARRANELRMLRHRHELATTAAKAPVAAGGLGPDYTRVEAEQREARIQAAEEIETTMEEISNLEGDALISRFVPEAFAKPLVDEYGDQVEFADTLARGRSLVPGYVQV